MIGGIPWRKAAVYMLVIAVLVGTNYVRLDNDGGRLAVSELAGRSAPKAEISTLFATGEFLQADGASKRDLFRQRAPVSVIPKIEPSKPQPLPLVDPNAVALARAQKLIDGVVLLGILGSGEGPVAVIEFDQEVKSVTQGQTVAAGFKVSELTLTYLVVRNELLGLEKKIVVGE